MPRRLAWLFVAQGLAGIFGATPSTAAAYIADVSEPEERPRLFGLLGASFGVGFMLGPVIGGLLVEFGLRVPFFAATGLALVNVLYGALVLPESLAPELRQPFRLSRANPLGALLHLKNHHLAGSLLLALLLLHVANHTLPATWPFFTMHSFGWTPSMVGYSLGLFGICTIVTQGAFVGHIVRRYGVSRVAVPRIDCDDRGFLWLRVRAECLVAGPADSAGDDGLHERIAAGQSAVDTGTSDDAGHAARCRRKSQEPGSDHHAAHDAAAVQQVRVEELPSCICQARPTLPLERSQRSASGS